MTGIRYHAAALLRAVAHRIHPVDTDAIPTIIKVPPGALDKIKYARPTPEFLNAVDRAQERRATRRPPAGGSGEAKAR